MKYNGWIVKMKKYMNESAREDADIQGYLNDNWNEDKKYENFVSYGEFDRLQFIPVEAWNEYHKEFLSSDWVGQQQTVMLFNIGEENESDIDSYILKDEENIKKGRFNALTMLHLSNKVKNTKEGFNEILMKIKKAISSFIDTYELKEASDILKYDVYGTFSSSEMAIIWSASQYVDIINILDYLRYFYFGDNCDLKIFIASYTIISLNPFYKGENADVKGEALIQIEFSPTFKIGNQENNDNFIIKNIGKMLNMNIISDKVMSSIGKYDFIVKVPVTDLLNFEYNNEFSRTKTVVLVNNNNKENSSWKSKIEKNIECLKVDIKYETESLKKWDSKLQRHIETYNEICTELEKYDICFEVRELLALMFSDYKRVISSSVDQKWLEDYEEQFKTIMDIIKIDVKIQIESIEKNNNLSMRKLLKICVFIVDLMQQQVDHILESSKLFLMSPNSNIGYTAQFDLMMHMYYGIIKSLISNAYEFRKNSWQYPLVPIVTFMNTWDIESNMLYTADNLEESKRLIQFRFPCDAWAKPMFYLPYLVHEVYHYIAPYDRGYRNLSFLVIALTESCVEYFMKLVKLPKEKYSLTCCMQYAYRIKSLVQFQLYSYIGLNGEEILISVEKSSAYRDKTFGYRKENISDMPIYQMQEALSNWWYKENQHLKFCEWIQSAIEEIIKFPSDLSEAEVTFLKDLNENIRKAIKNDDLPSIKDEFPKIVENLFSYMKEIYPDYAMIEQLKMGICEYLVQIAVQQTNKLITPQSVPFDLVQMGALRIIPIIEYLKIDRKLEDKEFEEYKEEFCNLYNNLIKVIQLSSEEEKLFSIELAEAWFGFFQRCYAHYMDKYSIYGLELRNQIENYKKEMKPVQKIQHVYKEYSKILRDKDIKWSLVKKELFKWNLKLVLEMQNQVSILEMNQNIKAEGHKERESFLAVRLNGRKIEPCGKDLTVYVLQNGFGGIMELLYNMVNTLNRYHKEIFGHDLGHDELWYRGVNNEKHHIIPSIYRKYADKENHVKYNVDNHTTNISLRQLQFHLLQHFRYQADGAPEILNQAIYQDNDYLALMQHYQLPSNLLDWSEDVFAAFYFALEDYIKGEQKKNSISPAIYLFDPAAYNKARVKIINTICGNNCKNEPKCKSYKNQYKLLKNKWDFVPNVALHANRKIMVDYFCTEHFSNDNSLKVYIQNENNILGLKKEKKYCECCKLPVAYYSSRLSPRIRAQSGQFLAFSLDVHPELIEKKKDDNGKLLSYEERLSFNYMALDNIQEYYLNNNILQHPFLLKMIIPEKECNDLAQLLRKFGIKTMKYYPELTHLKD